MFEEISNTLLKYWMYLRMPYIIRYLLNNNGNVYNINLVGWWSDMSADYGKLKVFNSGYTYYIEYGSTTVAKYCNITGRYEYFRFGVDWITELLDIHREVKRDVIEQCKQRFADIGNDKGDE